MNRLARGSRGFPLIALCGLLWSFNPSDGYGQCNPAGNPTRYEFDIDPTTMLNIMGQQFCTSQQDGTNCCGKQGSYRCLDLVFNLDNGPMNEEFGENCQGNINLMTAQGNFDALFFDVGIPNPMGNATVCADSIKLGNNYVIAIQFSGNAMGQIVVNLAVIDNMGMTVFSSMEIASPGQAVIFTICKPGFGCVEDEIVFGCCEASAALALAPGAPDAICTGDSTTLKVTGMNGTAPYTVMLKAASATDTTYFPVIVNDDMDGDNTMDMTTVSVFPTDTTTYTIISVEDNSGCVQPVMGQLVTIFVNPIPTVNPVANQTVCTGGSTDPVNFSGDIPGTVFNWTNDNPAIGLGSNGTGDIPAFIGTNGDIVPIFGTIEVTPTYTENGITCTGTPESFTITVNPVPVVNPVASQAVCVNEMVDQINFSSNVPGATFSWTRTPEGIGLADLGGGNFVPAFTSANAGSAPLTSTFTVTASFSNNGITCTGTPVQFDITVNPEPTVDPVASQTVCTGASTDPVNFSGSVQGTVFTWTNDNPAIGLGSSGTGDIPAFIATNIDPVPIFGTVEVTPEYSDNGITCLGTPESFVITVNPIPAVSAILDQTVCVNEMVAQIDFSSNIPGATFSWTRTPEAIGLPDLNGGNFVPSFISTNTETTPLTSTFTVTASFTNNGVTCTGTPIEFEVTVNPTPAVNSVSDQTVCNGAPTDPVIFSGPVPGTTYTWANDNTSIGLGASGSGNIASFSAVNNGLIPITATITVIPTYSFNGVTCAGQPVSFTITVNPTPTVNPLSNQSICSGDATIPVTFSGAIPGTQFNWTNSNPSIGLAGSGSGDIPSFVTINGGNTVQVATITVTPSFMNDGVDCAGTPIQFTITVYPRPTVFAGNDRIICQNQNAGLAASLGGGATGGMWSGGTGTFMNPASPITTYTPAPGEYGTSLELIFTTNDPAGPCTPVSDTLVLTINTLPLVFAGNDIMICKDENLDLSKLGAYMLANGSGVNTGTWSTSGTGAFLPNNTFAGATMYVPSMADRQAGFVILTLTSADPAGPCTPVSDQVILNFHPNLAMVCNDNVMIALDEDGMVEILPDMILEGDYDYSMFTVQVFVNGVNIGNKVDCSHVGKTLLVRVLDNCSGVYCTGSILVKDNLPPKLECSDIELICPITNNDPDYLKNILGISNAYPIVQDNCGVYTLTHKDTWVNQNCDDDFIGYLRRVWTATDASGNKATCTQYLNYLHQNINDVLFPPDVTLNCSSGPVNTTPLATGAPYLIAFGMPFPIFPDGGYCKLSATFNDNVLKSCDGTYDIIRTWIVYDMCSPTSPMPPTVNPKYYIQIIKVIDNVGPVLHCPADLTVSTDPLDCCATVNLPDIKAEDVCSRINEALARVEVRDPVTGDVLATYDLTGILTTFPGNNLADPDTLITFGFTPCLPLGTHTVTVHAEDDCGNTSTCSYNLTVADLSPPVPACDEITQVSLGIDGMIFVNASTFDDGSYDNCSDVYFKARRLETNACQSNDKFYDQVKFCCEDINDTILVILRVYSVIVPPGPVSLDFEEAHSNDCQVQVYVDDKLKPTCIAPSDISVSCENFDPSLWAYGAPIGADNCCVDTIITQANYNLFDTVCNKGTITRTFRVFDCGGQSNQCTQRIYVNYKQDYYVRFPNDVIRTTCDGSSNFGEPAFWGEDCELLGVSYEDEIFTVVPDACYKIERTWTIINWCTYNPNGPCIYVPNPNPNAIVNHPTNLVGPTVSPAGTPAPWAPSVLKVNPGDQANTNYSDYWFADANCYKYKQIIKIIDTQKPESQCPASPVEVCDLTTNDAQLWNAPYWFDSGTGSHDLCEAPSDLCITATDACSGANLNIRYLLFLDLDHNGTMETVISSTNLPDPNTVFFGNAGNPNFSGGTPQAFDERPVPLNQKYRFGIQATTDGNNMTACVRWNTLAQPDTYTIPELPYGTHKIKWIVEDGCGNEQVCEYTFVVKDCKPPTVVCLNGIAVNLMPTGMISIGPDALVEDAYDNCTPSGMLIYGIRGAGSGTGFPYNPDGSPQTSVTFDCNTLSFQVVEIWVMDLAGNSDYCTTYVNVQDNLNICNPSNATVAGMIQTENGQGLEDVNMQILGNAPNGQAPVSVLGMSDNTGHYTFPGALPMASDAVIVPLKDNDPLNGVSTFDLVLINKHILGLAPLGTPYKMIAADANNSRSITTFDIVELRKLILGIYQELPDNTSWRFVDKSYDFPNPYNPFQEVFPETKSLADVKTHMMDEDFVAVKTGDVNGNAVTSSLMFSDDRSDGILLFDTDDRFLKAGERFTVHLKSDQAVLGFQFTLYFPDLDVIDIQPGDGMGADNFGVFPDEHILTSSFNTDADQANAGEFSIIFRAESSGLLSHMLSVSSRVTKAEAYIEFPAQEMLDIGLRFNNADASTVVSGVGFELYQNQPNPWTNTTRVGFHLPEFAEATLTIFDETGRILLTRRGRYEKGYNSIAIDNSLLDTSGMLFYKLETETDSAVRQMVRMR